MAYAHMSKHDPACVAPKYNPYEDEEKHEPIILADSHEGEEWKLGLAYIGKILGYILAGIVAIALIVTCLVKLKALPQRFRNWSFWRTDWKLKQGETPKPECTVNTDCSGNETCRIGSWEQLTRKMDQNVRSQDNCTGEGSTWVDVDGTCMKPVTSSDQCPGGYTWQNNNQTKTACWKRHPNRCILSPRAAGEKVTTA